MFSRKNLNRSNIFHDFIHLIKILKKKKLQAKNFLNVARIGKTVTFALVNLLRKLMKINLIKKARISSKLQKKET